MSDKATKLRQLSNMISECRLCDQCGLQVQHGPPRNRGEGQVGIIIGIEPGKQETSHNQPFAGKAGQNLKAWLAEGGLIGNEKDLLRKFHLTSLLKCQPGRKTYRYRKLMFQNCSWYLHRQIAITCPRLAIILGQLPHNMIFSRRDRIQDLLGKIYSESQLNHSFFPVFPPDTIILPLPHPSPANPYAQQPSSRHRIIKTIQNVNEMMSQG